MASPVDSPWKCYEKWLRLMTLIDYAGKKICHDLLFVTEGLPEDGNLLYNVLKRYDYSIKPNKDQSFILYPDNHCTDKAEFDITLYTRIIQGLCGKKYIQVLTALRNLRNTLFHTGRTNLTDADFKTLWDDASNTLKYYHFDMSLVAGLIDCEFSRPQECGEPLLNCIKGLFKGNVEPFTCLFYMFCISGYLICKNINGINFLARVKRYNLSEFIFL